MSTELNTALPARRPCSLCPSPHGDCKINGIACCVDCGQKLIDEEEKELREQRKSHRRPWS